MSSRVTIRLRSLLSHLMPPHLRLIGCSLRCSLRCSLACHLSCSVNKRSEKSAKSIYFKLPRISTVAFGIAGVSCILAVVLVETLRGLSDNVTRCVILCISDIGFAPQPTDSYCLLCELASRVPVRLTVKHFQGLCHARLNCCKLLLLNINLKRL